ncbi:DndE family protein [Staphylococcus haemolyticus]|uniref:DndE family protein n=1 Tax=Staphylococcus haemolyticus TaxID=1283 RepID=UPI00214DB5A6|nr:DndE family protein [Staphylococcus haemolyticus]
MRKIKDNDALKEQIITLKAKLGIVSLNFLCAIAIFAMFNDLQREFLSPFFYW